jgi:hypothetical protein
MLVESRRPDQADRAFARMVELVGLQIAVVPESCSGDSRWLSSTSFDVWAVMKLAEDELLSFSEVGL